MAKTAKKFEVGDVVCLASSPDVPMTVESADEITGNLTVVWLDQNQKRNAAVFKPNTLIEFVPPS